MAPTPTAFTDLVGCTAPIQLAPIGGGVGTVELALAVCDAGGLGMVHSLDAAPLADRLALLRDGTSAPYGVGFFGFLLSHLAEDLELAAAEARVVDIFWGDPDAAVVARVHDGGALVFWQVGSAAEGLAAADAGCDAVVVQGVEAGGHVRGTTPLLALLAELVPRLDVPVIAAGGIASHENVRRAFEAGACAVRVGTRMVATTESAAHPDYVAALLDADGDDTELTMAFHVGWEDAPTACFAARSLQHPHRASRSHCSLTAAGKLRFPAGPHSHRPRRALARSRRWRCTPGRESGRSPRCWMSPTRSGCSSALNRRAAPDFEAATHRQVSLQPPRVVHGTAGDHQAHDVNL